MPEFMDDLHDAEREPEIDGVLEGEEFVLGRQFAVEGIEVGGDEQSGADHQGDGEEEEPQRKDEPRPVEHPLEEELRIEDGNLDVEDVREGLHPFLTASFVATLEQ